jgi:TatD DNase family protein
MMATSYRIPAVDAHCHIDLYQMPIAIVHRAEVTGVRTIAVTNAPMVFAHTQALAAGRVNVRAALGLHPELVPTHGQQIDDFLRLLPATRYVGEIGLDFVTKDQADRLRQGCVFDMILRACADAGDKVLTIHSRRASRAVIDAIGDAFPGTVILHWFPDR